MNYQEIDYNIIYDAIVKNDYDKIASNYQELCPYYDTIRLIIGIYEDDIRKEMIYGLASDYHNLIVRVIESLQYIRLLTKDDYDTIKLLFQMSYNSFGRNYYSEGFSKLLVLVFYNQNDNSLEFARSLSTGIDTYAEALATINTQGLKLIEKVQTLIDACKLYKQKYTITGARHFSSVIFCYLLLHACLSNNFNYLYHYLNNFGSSYEWLFFNGYLNGNFIEDAIGLPKLYGDIEKIFVEEHLTIN